MPELKSVCDRLRTTLTEKTNEKVMKSFSDVVAAEILRACEAAKAKSGANNGNKGNNGKGGNNGNGGHKGKKNQSASDKTGAKKDNE
jgi:hypothetical protein